MAPPVEVDLDLDAPGLSIKLPPWASAKQWRTLPLKEAMALTRYERAREHALQGIAPRQATPPTRRAAGARRSRRSALRGPPGTDRPREPREPRLAEGASPEDAVIAALVPGEAVVLELTPAQREAFSDPEGLTILSVLAHLWAARECAVPPADGPLTESFRYRLYRRLGFDPRRREVRAMKSRLAETAVIAITGFYRQRYRDDQRNRGLLIPEWGLTAEPRDHGQHGCPRRPQPKLSAR